MVVHNCNASSRKSETRVILGFTIQVNYELLYYELQISERHCLKKIKVDSSRGGTLNIVF